MHETEALVISLRPFEVVQEGPHEIAAYVDSGRTRPGDCLDTPIEERDAFVVVDPFGGRATVLGDPDRYERVAVSRTRSGEQGGRGP
jgi:hypothetical protein